MKALLGALTLVCLAGCVSLPPAPESAHSWARRQQVLGALERWQARGRMAVSAGKEGFSGGFTWVQSGARIELSFRGPLGVGGLRVEGKPGQLVAYSADGERVLLTDPENDLRARYGLAMPVDSMPQWLLGIPDAGFRVSARFGSNGLPTRLEQRGWEVDYQRWRRTSGWWLPARVELRRGDVRVRVLVDSWRIASLAQASS